MRYFWISITRDMSKPYINALRKYDFVPTSEKKDAEFFILDVNWNDGIHNGLDIMSYAREHGKPIFMVPHGTRGYLFWDNIYELNMDFDLLFVPAKGQMETLLYGAFPNRIVTMGFPWCDLKNFKSNVHTRNILFAPIHPEECGTYVYAQQWYFDNQEVWRKLLAVKDKYRITVYHSCTPEQNGLTIEDGITYIPSPLTVDAAVKQIDGADLVIAQETFAHLACARGKPVVMFDDTRDPPGTRDGFHSIYWPHYLPCPFNILLEDDLGSLFKKAGMGNSVSNYWRELYIGKPFASSRFTATILEYL